MAENNSSAPLLPCPFCGERTQINALGRSWWRMESGHRQDCLLSEVDHTVPQTDEQKQLLIDAWNTRAPQAVEAQAAPAEGMLCGVCGADEAFTGSCGGGRSNPRALCFERAALAATPAVPATGHSSAGDLAEVQAEPVADYPHEQMDALALARYKVVPSDQSMYWRHAVVAGDGQQHLYSGSEVDCQNMARKFAGAFLDGAFAFHQRYTAPQAQPADALDAANVDRWAYDQGRLAERERICTAIKTEDDYCVDQGDYMLDSNDCIKIARGWWLRPTFDRAAMAAAQEGGNAAKEA